MAYLTKEQYDRRRENAAKRNNQNEEIAIANGMSEDEASLISQLCSERHYIHSNMNNFAISGEQYNFYELLEIQKKIMDTDLPKLDFGRFGGLDMIDIDDMANLIEYDLNDDEPEDHASEEWQEWYDDNASRILDDLEELNTMIEDYLTTIDNKYNTHFAPTGAQRIF